MDTFEAIFDPVIYKGLRLIYEDRDCSTSKLKDLVMSALQERKALAEEKASRPLKGNANESKTVKEEVIEIKDDLYNFDEIPTSSIVIGSKRSSSAVFSDGCCVCQKTKNDSSGNKLFECTECHRSYHQNCHSPPIRDAKADDVRSVWYCGDCSTSSTAVEPAYNRPVAATKTSSSTNVTAGWTVNRPNMPGGVQSSSSSKETKGAIKRRIIDDD